MIHKALIVNDTDMLLFLTGKMVQKAQLAQEILTACDGEKAIAHFDALIAKGPAFFHEAPELVFLDLHMPRMDGLSFLELFSAHYASLFPDVRVVVLSSSIDPLEEAAVKKYPQVIDFVSNPISYDTLHKLQGYFTTVGVA